MEKAKFAREYGPSYQPRIGLWLAMRWPFGSKKTLDKIFYAFTLGVSSPNTLEDGAWKMGKGTGIHGFGFFSWLLKFLISGDSRMISLARQG